MLTLETERLFLRDFSMKDWDALNKIVSDTEVIRFMHFASWDEVKRREWFTRLVQDVGSQKRYNWAITLRNNGMLIGWFSSAVQKQTHKGMATHSTAISGGRVICPNMSTLFRWLRVW